MQIHESTRKHGVGEEDIEQAINHAMAVDLAGDDTKLFLGPARAGALLEVVTLVRRNRSELVIHAMGMRRKYRRLLYED